MNDKTSADPADLLYEEGMKFDLKQDKSPAAATLARATFQQAASMGHTGAIRALAHMTYEGNGGAQDKERALLLLWSAFSRGDNEALEELSDMVASYSEDQKNPLAGKDVLVLAKDIEIAAEKFTRLRYFFSELARNVSLRNKTP